MTFLHISNEETPSKDEQHLEYCIEVTSFTYGSPTKSVVAKHHFSSSASSVTASSETETGSIVDDSIVKKKQNVKSTRYRQLSDAHIGFVLNNVDPYEVSARHIGRYTTKRKLKGVAGSSSEVEK
ncbi:hypothetical protein LXL04_034617 [Taraxacum kok-saghyz]